METGNTILFAAEKRRKPVIAFGPEMPEFGSWEWVGAELAQELACEFETKNFSDQVPECDAVLFVKFKPSRERLREISQRSALLYCPVDFYGSCTEIDRDYDSLRLFRRIIVHSHRLKQYFRSYSDVEYLDHHVRFASPMRVEYLSEGPILWVGVRSNLPALVEWCNSRRLPEELWILTNPIQEDFTPDPADFGFETHNQIRIERWSPQKQQEWMQIARVALDIKGQEFRAFHKPPAKAVDFLASGLPLAMNLESCSVEYLSRKGFELASPDDPERWFSNEYFEETREFGLNLRSQLSRRKVGERLAGILQNVLAEKNSITDGKHDFPSSRTIHLANHDRNVSGGQKRTRIAILSLLFNWPSTAGGTIHTVETGQFLSRAGYDVQLFYARYPEWDIGNVVSPLPFPATELPFSESSWNREEIKRQFRSKVEKFDPDSVIITDSWNMKPLLAEAVRGYPYYLRLAALECLCPLNNVRLLTDKQRHFYSCSNTQLLNSQQCRKCVKTNGHLSGSLHRSERLLSGFGNRVYEQKLRQAMREAEAVLVVNPDIAELVQPYARSVKVVPSGFDPDRFPAITEENVLESQPPHKILFAGLVYEPLKGFAVLHEACRRLRLKRDDFELVATADPPGEVDAFTRYIGWQSQAALPDHIRESSMLIFPTLAEEALGRSAVEAMGCGRAVIASRIGGLPWIVEHGQNGLLVEPGNVDELAGAIEKLLDDDDVRCRLGRAGREKFERRFTWDVIIEQHYQPLLGAPVISAPKTSPVAI